MFRFMLYIITYTNRFCQVIIYVMKLFWRFVLKEKLVLNKKLKGDDGYKTFSIRIKDETVEQLEILSAKTNRSRNELIGILLDYAIANCEVK